MIKGRARYLLTGIVAWLLATAALHWLPVQTLFDPAPHLRMAAIAAANSLLFALVAFLAVRHLPADQRVPACAAIVTPGLFGDALTMIFFDDFFPHIDPRSSAQFGALLFLTYAIILTTGLLASMGAPHASSHRSVRLPRWH